MRAPLILLNPPSDYQDVNWQQSTEGRQRSILCQMLSRSLQEERPGDERGDFFFFIHWQETLGTSSLIASTLSLTCDSLPLMHASHRGSCCETLHPAARRGLTGVMGSPRSGAQVLLLCILSVRQAEIDAPSVIYSYFCSNHRRAPHTSVSEKKCCAAPAAVSLTGVLTSLDYSSKCLQMTENWVDGSVTQH